MSEQEFTQRFSELLHRHLIDAPGRNTPSVKQVAFLMGWPQINLYKILEGVNTFPFKELARFYQIAGGPIAALKYLVAQCDPSLALIRIDERNEIDGDMTDEIEDISSALGHFIDEKRLALRNGKLDDDERRGLSDIVLMMRKTCDRLIEEIRNHGEGKR